MGGRRLNQYDLCGGWDELTGRDAIFVTGGDASRAYYFIQALTHKGAFDDGRLLEIVDVHRSGVVIRRFAICLLENYTGYDWRPENPDY
jgi:hypothetical protein